MTGTSITPKLTQQLFPAFPCHEMPGFAGERTGTHFTINVDAYEGDEGAVFALAIRCAKCTMPFTGNLLATTQPGVEFRKGCYGGEEIREVGPRVDRLRYSKVKGGDSYKPTRVLDVYRGFSPKVLGDIQAYPYLVGGLSPLV